MLFKNPKTIPLIQYILFAMLVVATPFVVVTKFLQGAVYNVSHMMWSFFGIQLPIIATVIVAGFIGFLIWQRRNITKRRFTFSLVVLGMVILSQQVMDLYGGRSVYDLQRNWHYVAYSAYVFVFFRTFHIRGVSKATMIYASFFSALGLSIFDEFFQLFFSGRIFDVCDIAKDTWGAIMGLILVLFVSEAYGTIYLRRHSVWQKTLRGYLQDPLAVLTVTGLFSFNAIMISPLLTDHRYVGTFIIIFLTAFVIAISIIHFMQYRWIRMTIIIFASVIVTGLTGSLLINRNTQINYSTYGLTVYKGIPVPFFDLLIYPNGLPRLVDKKHDFNFQDKQFFLNQEPMILLVGTGVRGLGGKGFSIERGTMFLYNRNINAGTQLILLDTPEACKVFNRLKKAGLKVLFVIHSTC